MHTAILNVSGKEYGIDVSTIQEVVRFENATTIPETASYIEGVMNYRNHIVPLVNVMKKFGFNTDCPGQSARIIIINSGEGQFFGLVVDEVKDIAVVDSEQIDSGGEMLKDVKYLQGVMNMGGRIIPLIDVKKLLSGEERASLQQLHQRVEIRKPRRKP